MAKTQFTTKRQNISPKKLLGAMVALIAVFVLCTAVVSVASKYFAIRRHIRELEQEQAVLVDKHASLVKTNSYIQTQDGQEQLLREKYSVVKPGEGMIVIVPSHGDTATQKTPSKVSRFWNSLIRGLGFGSKD